ncbi:MAG: hypothetical protein R2800_09790 [Flavipsychrobacter sp.]
MKLDYYICTESIEALIADLALAGFNVADYKGGYYHANGIIIDEVGKLPNEVRLIEAKDEEELSTKLQALTAENKPISYDAKGNMVEVLSYTEGVHYNIRALAKPINGALFHKTTILSPNTPKRVIM